MFKTTTLVIDEKIFQRLIRKQELNRERARFRQTSAHFHYPMSVDGRETSSPFGPRPQAR